MVLKDLGILKNRSLRFKVKYLVLLACLSMLLLIQIPNVGDLVKKQIMMQKYLILRLNILIYLMVINLQMKYLMQR